VVRQNIQGSREHSATHAGPCPMALGPRLQDSWFAHVVLGTVRVHLHRIVGEREAWNGSLTGSLGSRRSEGQDRQTLSRHFQESQVQLGIYRDRLSRDYSLSTEQPYLPGILDQVSGRNKIPLVADPERRSPVLPWGLPQSMYASAVVPLSVSAANPSCEGLACPAGFSSGVFLEQPTNVRVMTDAMIQNSGNS